MSFANILLSGPCNLRCPHCIGNSLSKEGKKYGNRLDVWPLPNLDPFLEHLLERGIREVSVTATNTDPQLYRHEGRLIEHIRRRVPGLRLSLHTNGRLALARLPLFNAYDRATLSVPSFNPATYQAMTGTRNDPPPMAKILEGAKIPVKISTLLTRETFPEWREHLDHCERLGVRRLVFRHVYGDPTEWPVLSGEATAGAFMGNPVYRYGNLEVTVWRFETTCADCVNLFPDGEIRSSYLLLGSGTAEKQPREGIS